MRESVGMALAIICFMLFPGKVLIGYKMGTGKIKD